jgi:Holliday junction resolvase-like predicted endonuclease
MFEFDEEDRIFLPPSHTAIGRRGEVIVAKDLKARGFRVYASTAHSGPCDLIMEKGYEVFFVEVKTSEEGKSFGDDRNRCDLLARVYLKAEKIQYVHRNALLIGVFE